MNFRIHMLLDAWNLYIYICLVVVIIVYYVYSLVCTLLRLMLHHEK